MREAQQKSSPESPAIRAYAASDQEAVEALWGVAFPDAPPWNVPSEDIARKLHVQPDLFLVAESQGRLVGTAMGGYDGHRGWIYYLAVDPALRHRRIATRLMRALEARLVAMGCPKLNLMVRAENRAVIDFYEAIGYEVEDRVVMSRRLT